MPPRMPPSTLAPMIAVGLLCGDLLSNDPVGVLWGVLIGALVWCGWALAQGIVYVAVKAFDNRED
jgi:hypothetical protein